MNQQSPTTPRAPTADHDLVTAFLMGHHTPHGVAVHAVASPAGVLGGLMLAHALHPVVAAAAAALLSTAAVHRMSREVAAVSVVTYVALLLITVVTAPPWWAGAVLVVAAYVAQDASHHWTGEPTYSSQYGGRAGQLWATVEHTLLLLPLVWIAVARSGLIGAWVPRRRLVTTHLSSDGARDDLETIRTWVLAQSPPRDRTTHWWISEAPAPVQAAIARVATAGPLRRAFRALFPATTWSLARVTEMDEIYVTGPTDGLSSDAVFYLSHVDGPWAFVPFASVFRCLVAVGPNPRVQTHFPMSSSADEPTTYRIETGDVLAFDFNREPHFITADPAADAREPRILLKLHYVTAPRLLPALGTVLAQATGWYDRRARALFLSTLRPQTALQRAVAKGVLLTTSLTDGVARNLGASNVAWVAAWGLAALVARSPELFVVGVSFVHYTLYLTTFAHRRDIAFERFVRDAVFFKTVSMLTLATVWWSAGVPPLTSLLTVGVGVTLSLAATRALGWERTWFGAELGRVAPARLATPPYGIVPHPMILGAVIALVGVALHPHVRAEWPWLVPLHITLYACHAVQESLASPVEHTTRA